MLRTASRSLAVLALALAALLPATAAVADTTRPQRENPPQVGQCFNQSKQEVATAESPPRRAVDCREKHTSEVYRVAVWPGMKSPHVLLPKRVQYQAERVCQPWTVEGQAYFNYWAYYVPTPRQWAAGQRWVRCDALVATALEPVAFLRYTGRRLNVS